MGVTVSTPVLQRGNLMCCTLWVLASPYLRVESLHAVRLHCGCEHTCTSERKPYMLYVVCVSTPILQRGNCMWRVWAHPCFGEETLHAVCSGLEHTHTLERKPYVSYIAGASPLLPHRFSRGGVVFLSYSGCYTSHVTSEFRSSVKVEVVVLGFPS